MAHSHAFSFERLLCAVDFSTGSRTALRYASAIARRFDASLTAVFSEDPLLINAAAAAYDKKWLEKTAGAELRRFVAKSGAVDGEVACEVVSGPPAKALERVAARIDADLVVMGSHGMSGPKKWFFGSTSEKLLRKLAVPVLVVPGDGPVTQARLAKWPGRRVIVPVDLNDYRPDDIAAALGVAKAFGAEPLLVHVISASRFPSWATFDTGDFDNRQIEAAKQRLEQLTGSLGAAAACRVATGDPVEEIAALAAKSAAKLIVMPLRRNWRRGKTSYGLVCNAGIPVLALPGH